MEEILFEPRWDEEQFEIVKSRVVNSIKRNAANPNYIASSTMRKLLFGEESILAIDRAGTVESVEGITMDDLKEYYTSNLSPTVSRFHIVGSIGEDRTLAALADMNERWEAVEVNMPEFEFKPMPEESAIYFVDIPGWVELIVVLSTFFYLWLSMKRFYEQGYFVTFIKTGFATFVYMMLIFPATFLLMAATILFY